MAKKNKKNSAPQMQQIQGVSPQQLTGVFTSNVAAGSKAATAGNISDRQASSSDLVRTILMDGGASVVNPELVTQLAGVDKAFRPQITAANKAVSDAQATVTRLRARLIDPALRPATRASIEKQLATAETRLTTAQERANTVRSNFATAQQGITAGQPTLTDLMAERFPEARQAMERSQPFLDRMGQLGPAGERLMNALGQGYEAGQIGFNSAALTQAARQADIEAGRLGDSLMGEALRRVDLRGRLDSESTRDAIQSTRQGFAARGMATGNAALGAELLNRDRYSRQRAFEDLGFAQGIQTQDLGRQFNNQATQQQREMFNAQQANQVAMTNAEAAMRAQVANEEARRLGNQANVGMLGDAFNTQQMLNQEGLRAVGIGQSLASAANRYNQAMALYGSAGQNTGSQALSPAAQVAGNWLQGALATQAYNAAAQDYGTMLGRYGNYSGQSGGGTNWGGLIGGALAGGAALAIPGGAPFAPAAFALGSGIGGSIGR